MNVLICLVIWILYQTQKGSKFNFINFLNLFLSRNSNIEGIYIFSKRQSPIQPICLYQDFISSFLLGIYENVSSTVCSLYSYKGALTTNKLNLYGQDLTVKFYYKRDHYGYYRQDIFFLKIQFSSANIFPLQICSDSQEWADKLLAENNLQHRYQLKCGGSGGGLWCWQVTVIVVLLLWWWQ